MICFNTHDHGGWNDIKLTVIVNEHTVQQDNNSSSKLICVIQEGGAPPEIQNSILADNWLIVAVLTLFSIMIFHMGMVLVGGDILSAEYLCLSCRDTYHLHMYICMYIRTFMDSDVPTYLCTYKVNANIEHSIHLSLAQPVPYVSCFAFHSWSVIMFVDLWKWYEFSNYLLRMPCVLGKYDPKWSCLQRDVAFAKYTECHGTSLLSQKATWSAFSRTAVTWQSQWMRWSNIMAYVAV